MSTEFINDQWRLPNAWNGSESNVNKQSNYSLSFDSASSDYITGNINTPSTFTNLTVSCWVNVDSFSAIQNGVLSSSTNSGAHDYENGFALEVRNDNKFRFKVSSGGNTTNWLVASDTSSTNQWYHIACVVTPTQLELFVNGVSKGTESNSSLTPSFERFFIGSRFYSSAPANYFDGQIDGVAIFNYALSSSQITTLYGSSSTGIGNPMSLSPKPVAYYPLGDQDAFNGSNYLVPNSSLKDYVFDFTSSIINPSVTLTGLGISNEFSVSLWANVDTITSYRGPIGATSNSNWVDGFGIYINANKWNFFVDNWSAKKVTSDTTITTNTWFHLVGTFSSSGTAKFYINGTKEGTDRTGVTLDGLNNNFGIGNIYNGGGLFDGKLSNVQIWNKELIGSEVETLYNNGSPYTGTQPQNSNLQGWWKLDASATYDSSTTTWTIPDDSSNSNTGTSSGMTQANLVQSDLSFTSGYSPYALDFDAASSDYIDIPTITLANDFTISAWVTNPLTGSANDQLLSAGSGFFIYSTAVRNGGANAGKMTYYNGSALIAFTDVIRDDTWHHVSLTYNSSTTTLTGYTDGNQTYSATYDAGTNNQINKIGDNLYSHNWLGKISNLSIWNAALTSAQVTEIYSEGVPQNLNNHSAYSNLVSWWQLGSNSSFNSSLNQWTCIDEKGTNTGESSQTFNEDAIVDGVGSYANGLSSGMGGDEVVGDAPYSTANSLSVNMDVLDRTEDTPA